MYSIPFPGIYSEENGDWFRIVSVDWERERFKWTDSMQTIPAEDYMPTALSWVRSHPIYEEPACLV